MRTILLICVLVIFSVVCYIIPHKVYGDGFTQESLPAASVGNRTVSVFIKINPPIITSESNQDRYLLFRWFDVNTNQTIQHTTFLVLVTKHNQPATPILFHTHTGILKIKITPSYDPKKWSINATAQPFLDGTMYMPQGDDTIDLTAPILGEGGLYHIYMSLITIDNDQNLFMPENAPKFDSYLSVGDVANHTITYHNNSYNTTLVSYYDKATSYNFDPSKMQISWTMPFDWNTTRFQNMPIFVHEELRVPKSFKEFASTPTFVANVNGNPITGQRIVVDPYSINNTVIAHILLNKIDIENLAKITPLRVKTMNFTLVPKATSVKTSSSMLSDFGGWAINLGWNPSDISANSQNLLQLTFFDAFTEQQVSGDMNYDLKILDSYGNTILSKIELTAKGGKDSQMLSLPDNGIYRMQVNLKSIVKNGLPDTSRIGIARGDLVIPSTFRPDHGDVPEFPFALPILAISIMSLLVIYRIKFRTRI